MPSTAVERIAAATRGARFPTGLSNLLTWAAYNRADRQTMRELNVLPWRIYANVLDVADQVERTRRQPTNCA